jgi:hypothetical protein
LWHDQGLSHGLAIAESLQERLHRPEYFGRRSHGRRGLKLLRE